MSDVEVLTAEEVAVAVSENKGKCKSPDPEMPVPLLPIFIERDATEPF